MEMIVLDTLAKLYQHGHGMFGWCSDCGFPPRYWDDVKARRVPQRAIFDIYLPALIHESGGEHPVVGLAPIPCPRCCSRKTDTRVTAPSKPMRRN